jgi:hypothetical protein
MFQQTICGGLLVLPDAYLSYVNAKQPRFLSGTASCSDFSLNGSACGQASFVPCTQPFCRRGRSRRRTFYRR